MNRARRRRGPIVVGLALVAIALPSLALLRAERRLPASPETLALIARAEAVALGGDSARLDDLMGQVEKQPDAVPSLQEALRHQPGSANLRMGLGKALLDQGRPNDAIHAFQGILRDRDAFVPALEGMANAASRLGQRPTAILWLDRGVASARTGDPGRLRTLYTARCRELILSGEAANAEGRFAAAEDFFRRSVDDAARIVEGDPESRRIDRFHSAFLTAAGDCGRARALIGLGRRDEAATILPEALARLDEARSTARLAEIGAKTESALALLEASIKRAALEVGRKLAKD